MQKNQQLENDLRILRGKMEEQENEIERLKNELVDEETLRAVKTRAKAGLIRQLNSNSGLAFQLVNAEGKLGDWREVFKQLDKINAVTAQDIQRVTRQYFTNNNRVIGLLEPAPKNAEKK